MGLVFKVGNLEPEFGLKVMEVLKDRNLTWRLVVRSFTMERLGLGKRGKARIWVETATFFVNSCGLMPLPRQRVAHLYCIPMSFVISTTVTN